MFITLLNKTSSNYIKTVYNKCLCFSVSLFNKKSKGSCIIVPVYLSSLLNFDFDKISVNIITPFAMSLVFPLSRI